MAYFSFSDALNISLDESQQRLAKSEANYRNTVFLSHSSKDDKYVDGVKKLLIQHEVNVYVDNGDTRLPENPSPETATILRNEIIKSDRLIVMATINSSKSGWIPWELGMGDGHKGADKVAILPLSNLGNEELWPKREYFALYPIIRKSRVKGYIGDYWIVDPGHNKPVTFLKNWLF